MGHVLLLNASFEPLTVISDRRAVSLLLRDRVDAATDHVWPIRCVRSVFQLPSVVRLRRFIQVPRRGITWSRAGVLQRDGHRCAYCGDGLGAERGERRLSRRSFTVDHIMPRSRGGADSWLNTVCACPECNQLKGNRTPAEAGFSLLWEPTAPRVNRIYAIGGMPKAWHIYLQ
jgi:5-methylcytosine-specific restriction endonuclease McrA